MIQKPTLKAIHICNSLKPTLNLKLQKSMPLPTPTTKKRKPAGNNVYKK
jgi:hypothetical protein